MAGGSGRQKNGSIGAVSGAPLTVTTNTLYFSLFSLFPWTPSYVQRSYPRFHA